MNIYSKPFKITRDLVHIMEMDGSKVWSGNYMYLWRYGGNTYDNVHLPKPRKILIFLPYLHEYLFQTFQNYMRLSSYHGDGWIKGLEWKLHELVEI